MTKVGHQTMTKQKSKRYSSTTTPAHQKSRSSAHAQESRCQFTKSHFMILVLIIFLTIVVGVGSYLIVDSVASIQSASSDASSSSSTSSSAWTGDDDTSDNTGYYYYDSLAQPDSTPMAAPIKVKDPYASADYGTDTDTYAGYSKGYGDEMIIQRDEEAVAAVPTPLPTKEPTSSSASAGVIYQTVFHDEESAKYMAELTTQVDSPTQYPTIRPTETSAPTMLVTDAPTPSPTTSDPYDSVDSSSGNQTSSPTAAPTALVLTMGSSDQISQLDLSQEAVDAFVASLVAKASGGVSVAAEGFGRLYQSSVGYLRLLVPEFRDKSFVLSTGEINGDAAEVLGDADFFNLVKAKLYKWSNKSYTINRNGDVGVQRIGVPYKYKKRPSCTNIRKKLLKLANKRDSSFTQDDSSFAYYAALCYQGSSSSSMIDLHTSSLPMFFQQLAKKLQWLGTSASLVRTQSNTWGYLASLGDLLTVSGGSLEAPDVTYWGPEGFLPMQKQAFGWLSPKSYRQIIPSSTEVTYTLRTLREGTLSNSSFPTALVWRDLIYDTDVWFSFYESSKVFGETYEEEMGDLAHGSGLGFAVHVPASAGTGSVRTRLFGQSYQHPSGLLIKTTSYSRDAVHVPVSYRANKQLSVVPYISISSKKIQSGTSKRYSKTQVNVNLDRDASGIDQTTLDPFVLSNYLRVECEWGNFTNGAGEDDLVLVGPTLMTAGSDESNIDLKEYTSNLEAFTSSIVVSFSSKGSLTSSEKKTAYPCRLHVGKFLQKDISIFFI